MIWFLIAVRQEVKRIDSSLVVHAPGLAIMSDSTSINKILLKSHANVIESFSSTSRYLDDLLNIDNPYFEQMVSQI